MECLDRFYENRDHLMSLPWWEGDRKFERSARRYVEVMLGELFQAIHAEQITNPDVVDRIFATLCVSGIQVRKPIGHSIGFKKPGPSAISWFDVHGSENPLAASQAVPQHVRESYGRRGMSEYGITTLHRWETATVEDVADGVVPMLHRETAKEIPSEFSTADEMPEM